MGQTTIEWTEMTWNPVRGCSRISPGCTHCYAERMAARFCGSGEPFHLFADKDKSGSKWTGRVELIPDALEIPLRRQKPTTWFVNSMSDLFHEALPDEDILRVLKAMGKAPRHTYQVLTKRAEWMKRFMRAHLYGKPPRYLWLGVSVEDQKRKDRIDHLRETPAAVRFLSLEPLLEDLGELDLTGIHWVIVGGESGTGARACNVEWIRSIVRQCRAAGVAVFVKQLGAAPFERTQVNVSDPGAIKDLEQGGYWKNAPLKLKDRKGGDMSEWPEDLRVREMPEVSR